jgi:hypothetical protein
VKPGETELQMTERHVRTGIGCLTRQRQLVARIDKDDPSYQAARQLLALFQRTQILHLRHRRRLLARGRDAFHFEAAVPLQLLVPLPD